MHDGLVPDISLGTHFYNDLVEMDMVYLGILPGQECVVLNNDILDGAPNRLLDILPEEEKWLDTVKVISGLDQTNSRKIHLYVHAMKQEAMCYSQMHIDGE